MSLELVDPQDANDAGDMHVEVILNVPLGSVGFDRSDAMIDEWGRQSFPASDPPSNW